MIDLKPSDLKILVAVADCTLEDGCATTREIVKMTGITRQSVYRRAEFLQKNGILVVGDGFAIKTYMMDEEVAKLFSRVGEILMNKNDNVGAETETEC